jgi:hypothetical protein
MDLQLYTGSVSASGLILESVKLYKDGSPTAMQCSAQIGVGANQSAKCSDTADSVSVVAGDSVALEGNIVGVTSNNALIKVSLLCE